MSFTFTSVTLDAVAHGQNTYIPDVLMGQQVVITLTSSETNVDWSLVEIWLGCKDCLCSFLQAQGESTWTGATQVFTFQIQGQGHNLPLIAYWQTAAFSSWRYISFAPPVLHLAYTTAYLHQATSLQAYLSNVPNWPHDIYQCVSIKVFKVNQTDNLCDETFFGNASDFNASATCSLRPAALSGILVQVLAKTYQGDFTESEATSPIASGLISYSQPQHTALQDPTLDTTATQGTPIDMDAVAKRAAPLILLHGVDFPQVSQLQMTGATIPGYRRGIVPASDVAQQHNLELTVVQCLSVKILPTTPEVRLYLGDLEASFGHITLRMPSPIITAFSFVPSVPYDTSPNQSMSLQGTNFGQRACDTSVTEGIQLIGDEGGATIEVGDLALPCTVQTQNSTHIECSLSGALTYPRDYSSPDYLPPVRREASQTFSFRLGRQFLSKNEESGGGLLALDFSVVLLPCDAGFKRDSELSYNCVECPTGRYSVVYNAETAGLNDVNQWPLQCAECAGATYQDTIGQSACKACPANTYAMAPKDTRWSCYCLPGYYSNQYDTGRDRAMPGEACISCAIGDLVAETDVDEVCGENLLIESQCDAPYLPTCVAGGAGGYKVCKAYCAGGTAWPLAKSSFYLESEEALAIGRRLTSIVEADTIATFSNSNNTETFYVNVVTRTPVITRCDPTEACLAHNQCQEKYTDYLCGSCAFYHYRDKNSGKCVKCGIEQTIGTVIMGVVATVLVLGGLIGTSMFLRLQADFQLRQQLLAFVKEIFSSGHGKTTSNFFLDRIFRREKRIRIKMTQRDLGVSLRWARHKDMGVVFRVADSVVHVAGILEDSPAKGIISPNWKLLTINGAAVRAMSEEEVKKRIAEEGAPLRFVFRSNELRSKDAAEGNMLDDRKMLIMLIGIMNTFQQISAMSFTWPPIFILLAETLQQFSFNFNFFQPECSVNGLPFLYKWLGTLAVPYVVSVPLCLSFLFVRKTMRSKHSGKDGRRVKDWLLLNAFGRTLCMAIIVFLPVHLEQLLVPLGCKERSEGRYFVDETPDTLCSLGDKRYVIMLGVSMFGLSVVAGGTVFLFSCIFKSYHWQYGIRPRDYIPFYAGITEVSAQGQKGFSWEVRQRVLSNLVAVISYETKQDAMADRAQLFRAANELGHRSRWVQEAQGKRGVEVKAGQKLKGARYGTGYDEHKQADGTEIPEEVQRMAIIKGRKVFLKRQVVDTEGEGSVLTYGWIFFINLYWRQLLTLVTIKLSKTTLVVIGAGFQILIFASNVALLFIYKPYKANKISVVETGLLCALSAMLWLAVLQELLSNHVNAHLYQKHIERFNTVIEMLAVGLVLVLVFVPAWQVWQMAVKAFTGQGDPDEKLNQLYFENSLAKEHSSKGEQITRQEEKELEAALKEQKQKLAMQRRANALRAVLDGKVIEATATAKEKKAIVHIQAFARGWLLRKRLHTIREHARERIRARAELKALEEQRQAEAARMAEEARLAQAAEALGIDVDEVSLPRATTRTEAPTSAPSGVPE
eukprot:CAMPEP_0178383968 /NCGR_PEP_ID=MMETSP0689_2-20121128/7274_1 /TAXON_ID=160604 /ORGANISM="Amphidinium massartii, Strain CS-259" /LENGTH=1515 /DNA_ID=CAMNT_0020004203 /DNA_START=1 /DNA_END=4546 /DNA_ORIENTATION=-